MASHWRAASRSTATPKPRCVYWNAQCRLSQFKSGAARWNARPIRKWLSRCSPTENSTNCAAKRCDVKPSTQRPQYRWPPATNCWLCSPAPAPAPPPSCARATRHKTSAKLRSGPACIQRSSGSRATRMSGSLRNAACNDPRDGRRCAGVFDRDARRLALRKRGGSGYVDFAQPRMLRMISLKARPPGLRSRFHWARTTGIHVRLFPTSSFAGASPPGERLGRRRSQSRHSLDASHTCRYRWNHDQLFRRRQLPQALRARPTHAELSALSASPLE
jgi:hypothetical protein